MAVVIVYESGLVRAMQTDGKDWNKDTADEVKHRAIGTCPSSSGALRGSHRVEQNRVHGRFSTGFSVTAGNGLPDARALWVHNGTGLYGPRGMPIVPVNTPKKKYLHLPSHMGFRWTLSTVLAGGPRKRRKGVRGPYVRLYDPTDPFGHAESVDGDPGQPWLRDAGDAVAHRHGAW